MLYGISLLAGRLAGLLPDVAAGIHGEFLKAGGGVVSVGGMDTVVMLESCLCWSGWRSNSPPCHSTSGARMYSRAAAESALLVGLKAAAMALTARLLLVWRVETTPVGQRLGIAKVRPRLTEAMQKAPVP